MPLSSTDADDDDDDGENDDSNDDLKKSCRERPKFSSNIYWLVLSSMTPFQAQIIVMAVLMIVIKLLQQKTYKYQDFPSQI